MWVSFGRGHVGLQAPATCCLCKANGILGGIPDVPLKAQTHAAGLHNQAPEGKGIGQSNMCHLFLVSPLLPRHHIVQASQASQANQVAEVSWCL